MPSLAEQIAEEIFRTIERERRIIKDDLIHAVERCIAQNNQRYTAAVEDLGAGMSKIIDDMRAFEAKQVEICKVPAGTIITADFIRKYVSDVEMEAARRGIALLLDL